MRILALILGLAAGGLFVATTLLGNFRIPTGALAFWAPEELRDLAGQSLWYGIAGAALLGGLLALLAPSLGAFFLFLAATGWAVLALRLEDGMGFRYLIPLGLAVAGTLVAYLAGILHRRRRRRELEEEDEDEPEQEAPAPPPVAPVLPTGGRVQGKRVEPEMVLSPQATIIAPVDPAKLSDFGTAVREELQRNAYPGTVPPTEAPRPAEIRPATIVAAEPVEPEEEPAEGDPPRRRSALVPALVGLNVLVLLLIAGAVAYFLLQRHEPPPSTAPLTAAVEPAPEPEALPPAGLTLPATPEPAPAPADPAPVAPAPVVVAAAPAPQTFTDPFAYCAEVKTIDTVDGRYGGPPFTEAMAEVLSVPDSASPDRIRWRCVDGAVLACQSFDWPHCAVTPTVTEMVDFCTRQPTVERLLAPAGTWSCRNGRPVLPQDASWPVDERGFLPRAWFTVPPPG